MSIRRLKIYSALTPLLLIIVKHQMAGRFSGDFARLVPINRLVQYPVTKLYTYLTKDENHSTFHVSFIGRGDTRIGKDQWTMTQPSTVNLGVMGALTMKGQTTIPSLLCMVPEMARLGWRAGKGTRISPANNGVGLLLAESGERLLEGREILWLQTLPTVIRKQKLGSKICTRLPTVHIRMLSTKRGASESVLG